MTDQMSRQWSYPWQYKTWTDRSGVYTHSVFKVQRKKKKKKMMMMMMMMMMIAKKFK
jgi:hypothetical protein